MAETITNIDDIDEVTEWFIPPSLYEGLTLLDMGPLATLYPDGIFARLAADGQVLEVENIEL